MPSVVAVIPEGGALSVPVPAPAPAPAAPPPPSDVLVPPSLVRPIIPADTTPIAAPVSLPAAPPPSSAPSPSSEPPSTGFSTGESPLPAGVAPAARPIVPALLPGDVTPRTVGPTSATIDTGDTGDAAATDGEIEPFRVNPPSQAPTTVKGFQSSWAEFISVWSGKGDRNRNSTEKTITSVNQLIGNVQARNQSFLDALGAK